MGGRWANRPPEAMLEKIHWVRYKGFGLIARRPLSLPQKLGLCNTPSRVQRVAGPALWLFAPLIPG
ncbi:hypothetical protein GCM10022214_04170 [Actinomadura miaoliensis]|uniref:Transposase n=1 Tax=Actinomadura miaoliensis TaxID=430685 RepID=A0ABP7UZ20_9ACTN